MTTRYLDIHVIQTIPPSNVNRDDTGAPKTAIYGGVQRSRVSSQAWKRATRLAFHNSLDPQSLGIRTTRVVSLIANRLHETEPDIDLPAAAAAAGEVLKAAGIKLTKPRGAKKDETAPTDEEELDRSGYLIFLSSAQVDTLAALAATIARGGTVNKKSAKEAITSDNSLDVAMFGRMVADDKDLNVDAAVQVAHALSVHGVDNEFDYFTAVDDRNTDDAGAGMIGTVEFNSSTLYRYATVDVAGLQRNLGTPEAAAAAAREFVAAFVTSMPTGKQNTFANRTLPDAVVVMARSDQPVNLVGAFETPVNGGAGVDRIQAACLALARHTADLSTAFNAHADHTYVVQVGDRTQALCDLGESCTMAELTTAVHDTALEAAHSLATRADS